jgi:hypothetical protein
MTDDGPFAFVVVTEEAFGFQFRFESIHATIVSCANASIPFQSNGTQLDLESN